MKKVISGLVLAMASTFCFAQGVVGTGTGGTTNVAGGPAAGAGAGAGAGTVIATNTVLIVAGAIAAGMIVAGSKSETTTTHTTP